MSFYTKRSSTTAVVIHCSYTPPTMDIGAAEIREWHKGQGWSDIGYHYVIRRDGSIEPGRPEDAMGAHVRGHNGYTIGICMVGGRSNVVIPLEQTDFSAAQWKALDTLVGRIERQYPGIAVKGHNDFTNMKSCPTFKVSEWLATREKKLSTPPVAPPPPASGAPSGRWVYVSPVLNTMWRIAATFGESAQEIVRLNSQLDPQKLKDGDRVYFPE